MSQTTAVKKSSMPARMIIARVLTAIAGWMSRNYAASRMQEALRIAAIRDPKHRTATMRSTSTAATAFYHARRPMRRPCCNWGRAMCCTRFGAAHPTRRFPCCALVERR